MPEHNIIAVFAALAGILMAVFLLVGLLGFFS
jgi:hypothetical protein